jgi:hypothetical protein
VKVCNEKLSWIIFVVLKATIFMIYKVVSLRIREEAK